MIAVVFIELIGCQSKISTKNLDLKMNQWHADVAQFKLDDYFSFMHESFVFLGTAPGERWVKESFYQFSKPYFDKKTTWNFKTIDRNWYFSNDGRTAWFEENLETWMKGCRASGVLIYENNEWKITHYNLTVLIENEKMEDFITLRNQN